MSDSLRLAPLDTSSVGSNKFYMHPPISPPPRSCSWRSNSPTSVQLPPPPPSPAVRIDALTFPVVPPPLVSPPSLPVPTLPAPSALSQRYPSLLSAAPVPTPPAPAVPTTLASPVVKPRRKRSRAVREVFRCTFKNCDKVSSENSNLKAHMRLHTGETPYACLRPGCGKRFRWKSSLTYHEKALHSNLRPFQCESCQKRFVERRKLQLHRDWCPTMRQQATLKTHNIAVAPAAPLMLMRTTSPIAVPVYNP